MGKLKYVCMSDLHLGQDMGLLTKMDYSEANPEDWHSVYDERSPVLDKLVDCLEWLLENVDKTEDLTLVLNGDLMELALTPMNNDAKVLVKFLERVMSKQGRLFENVIFVPGNHDHHLWELARETDYVDHIPRFSNVEKLAPVGHITKMLAKKATSSGGKVTENDFARAYLMDTLVTKANRVANFDVDVAYPNFAVGRDDYSKVLIFTHGHYAEKIYSAISTLEEALVKGAKPAQTVQNLETDNYAWIDFLWSTLGRSGDAGKYVEVIYASSENRAAAAAVFAKELIEWLKKHDQDKVAAALLRIVPEGILEKLLEKIIEAALAALTIGERWEKETEKVLGDEAKKGLNEYFGHAVLTQLKNDLKNMGKQPDLPGDITFVFGHTHKPFAQYMPLLGSPARVKVYNTGGWVIDSTSRAAKHGGALTLFDENLDGASIVMYREMEDGSQFPVTVEPGPKDEMRNEFTAQIDQLISKAVNGPTDTPWRAFAREVAGEVPKRRKFVKATIDKYLSRIDPK